MTDDAALEAEMQLYEVHLKRLESLRSTAVAFRFIAWVIAILSVVGGFLIAVHTDEFDSTHPYVAIGLATGFSGFVFGMAMNLAAVWALAWVAGRNLDTARADSE